MEQTKLDVKLYIQRNSSYQMKTSELFSACPPGYDPVPIHQITVPLTYVPI